MKGYYIRFIKIVPALGIGLSFKSRAFPVSAGAAVITPQRRFTRALQGSPKSLNVLIGDRVVHSVNAYPRPVLMGKH